MNVREEELSKAKDPPSIIRRYEEVEPIPRQPSASKLLKSPRKPSILVTGAEFGRGTPPAINESSYRDTPSGGDTSDGLAFISDHIQKQHDGDDGKKAPMPKFAPVISIKAPHYSGLGSESTAQSAALPSPALSTQARQSVTSATISMGKTKSHAWQSFFSYWFRGEANHFVDDERKHVHDTWATRGDVGDDSKVDQMLNEELDLLNRSSLILSRQAEAHAFFGGRSGIGSRELESELHWKLSKILTRHPFEMDKRAEKESGRGDLLSQDFSDSSSEHSTEDDDDFAIRRVASMSNDSSRKPKRKRTCNSCLRRFTSMRWLRKTFLLLSLLFSPPVVTVYSLFLFSIVFCLVGWSGWILFLVIIIALCKCLTVVHELCFSSSPALIRSATSGADGTIFRPDENTFSSESMLFLRTTSIAMAIRESVANGFRRSQGKFNTIMSVLFSTVIPESMIVLSFLTAGTLFLAASILLLTLVYNTTQSQNDDSEYNLLASVLGVTTGILASYHLLRSIFSAIGPRCKLTYAILRYSLSFWNTRAFLLLSLITVFLFTGISCTAAVMIGSANSPSFLTGNGVQPGTDAIHILNASYQERADQNSTDEITVAARVDTQIPFPLFFGDRSTAVKNFTMAALYRIGLHQHRADDVPLGERFAVSVALLMWLLFPVLLTASRGASSYLFARDRERRRTMPQLSFPTASLIFCFFFVVVVCSFGVSAVGTSLRSQIDVTSIDFISNTTSVTTKDTILISTYGGVPLPFALFTSSAPQTFFFNIYGANGTVAAKSKVEIELLPLYSVMMKGPPPMQSVAKIFATTVCIIAVVLLLGAVPQLVEGISDRILWWITTQDETKLESDADCLGDNANKRHWAERRVKLYELSHSPQRPNGITINTNAEDELLLRKPKEEEAAPLNQMDAGQLPVVLEHLLSIESRNVSTGEKPVTRGYSTISSPAGVRRSATMPNPLAMSSSRISHYAVAAKRTPGCCTWRVVMVALIRLVTFGVLVFFSAWALFGWDLFRGRNFNHTFEGKTQVPLHQTEAFQRLLLVATLAGMFLATVALLYPLTIYCAREVAEVIRVKRAVAEHNDTYISFSVATKDSAGAANVTPTLTPRMTPRKTQMAGSPPAAIWSPDMDTQGGRLSAPFRSSSPDVRVPVRGRSPLIAQQNEPLPQPTVFWRVLEAVSWQIVGLALWGVAVAGAILAILGTNRY